MKKLITILLVVLAFNATAQNHGSKSNIVIMDKTGDPFYLIIDDVVQNIIPSYQLKVIGLPASYHEIKLLYTNGVIIQVKEHVTLQQHKQYTGFVNWIGGNKKLNWIEVVNINQSMYGQNVLVVQYAGKNTNTCHLCTGVNPPGQHYHPDGTIHNNYTGNGAHYPPNGNGQYPPHGNYNPNCVVAVPTIQPILDEMENLNFADKKMEYAKDALANKCITADQAYQIVESFTFDSDRVKIAKYCYDRMTDQIYANKLLDLFPYSGTRNEVRKYFTK